MRYFLEVSYKGTAYAGFQVQKNANTIQAEIEKVLSIVLKHPVELTGSSRTDTGVHALQNFFHFDIAQIVDAAIVYNLNAILPKDIVVRSIFPVPNEAHCRFDALYRQYRYCLTAKKDPFSTNTAWYYPYNVDIELLNKAAALLFNFTDFTSFSKLNSQAFTNQCTITKSEWILKGHSLEYYVQSNRFLRGMVRGLVGTMILVGRGKTSLKTFEQILLAKDCSKANFATPAQGLFLVEVAYPPSILERKIS